MLPKPVLESRDILRPAHPLQKKPVQQQTPLGSSRPVHEPPLAAGGSRDGSDRARSLTITQPGVNRRVEKRARSSPAREDPQDLLEKKAKSEKRHRSVQPPSKNDNRAKVSTNAAPPIPKKLIIPNLGKGGGSSDDFDDFQKPARVNRRKEYVHDPESASSNAEVKGRKASPEFNRGRASGSSNRLNGRAKASPLKNVPIAPVEGVAPGQSSSVTSTAFGPGKAKPILIELPPLRATVATKKKVASKTSKPFLGNASATHSHEQIGDLHSFIHAYKGVFDDVAQKMDQNMLYQADHAFNISVVYNTIGSLVEVAEQLQVQNFALQDATEKLSAAVARLEQKAGTGPTEAEGIDGSFPTGMEVATEAEAGRKGAPSMLNKKETKAAASAQRRRDEKELTETIRLETVVVSSETSADPISKAPPIKRRWEDPGNRERKLSTITTTRKSTTGTGGQSASSRRPVAEASPTKSVSSGRRSTRFGGSDTDGQTGAGVDDLGFDAAPGFKAGGRSNGVNGPKTRSTSKDPVKLAKYTILYPAFMDGPVQLPLQLRDHLVGISYNSAFWRDVEEEFRDTDVSLKSNN